MEIKLNTEYNKGNIVFGVRLTQIDKEVVSDLEHKGHYLAYGPLNVLSIYIHTYVPIVSKELDTTITYNTVGENAIEHVYPEKHLFKSMDEALAFCQEQGIVDFPEIPF